MNVSAQKKLQYLPASLNTLWLMIILTNRLSLLLLFISKLISTSEEIPLGTFLNLVSMIFQRKKKLKNQYIENDELYRISFLSWAMTLENL